MEGVGMGGRRKRERGTYLPRPWTARTDFEETDAARASLHRRPQRSGFDRFVQGLGATRRARRRPRGAPWTAVPKWAASKETTDTAPVAQSHKLCQATPNRLAVCIWFR